MDRCTRRRLYYRAMDATRRVVVTAAFVVCGTEVKMLVDDSTLQDLAIDSLDLIDGFNFGDFLFRNVEEQHAVFISCLDLVMIDRLL